VSAIIRYNARPLRELAESQTVPWVWVFDGRYDLGLLSYSSLLLLYDRIYVRHAVDLVCRYPRSHTDVLVGIKKDANERMCFFVRIDLKNEAQVPFLGLQ
jgi:hypothetical protein